MRQLLLFLMVGFYLCASLFTGRVYAQPANDSICNAIFIALSDTCVNMGPPNGDNTGATQEMGEPIASCFSGGTNSVWFKFVAPSSGFVSLSTDYIVTGAGPNTDTEIALYSLAGGDCTDFSDLQEIACSQDVAGNLQYNSVIPFAPVPAGDTMYVSVSGWNGTQGTFCLDVSAFNPPPAASNDTLCNAVMLTVGDTCTGSNGDNTNALFEIGESASWCVGSLNSVWYQFVAPPSGYVNISTDIPFSGTNTSTDITLYAATDGNCSDLSDLFALGCAANGATGVGFGSTLDSIPVTPGDTFYVSVVDGSGTFCIEVHEVTPSFIPSNDSLCNAIMLTVGDTCLSPNGDNSNSGIQVGEPNGSCFFGNTGSVWFSFIAPISGLISIASDIDVAGVSNTDTEIALYELPGGDCTDLSDLVELDCDQDGGQGIGFNAVLQTVPVVPGDVYYIQVSGSVYEQGAFCLELSAAPANDTACNAVDLPVDGMLREFSNFGAGVEPLEDSLIAPPAGNGFSNVAWDEGQIHNSVWFSFVAPSTGGVLVDLCNNDVGTTFDTQVAIYEVDQCDDFNTFSLLGANDNIPGSLCNFASILEVFCLIPGNTYYILVDGWQGESGTFGISLSAIAADPLLVSFDAMSPDCPDDAIGMIDLTVSGGGSPYSYLWNNGSMDEDLDSLSAGTYIVTVTDACDTSLVDSVTLSPGTPLSLNAGDNAIFCSDQPYVLGGLPTGSGGLAFVNPRAYALGQPTGASDFLQFSLDDLTVANTIASGLGNLRVGDFAEGILYVIDNDTDELSSLDLSTGGLTTIGTASPSSGHNWVGMAFDPNSMIMYGLSSDGLSSELFSIDLSTGATSSIGTLGITSASALAADLAGKLYTINLSDDQLYDVSASTGSATAIGSLGYNAFLRQSMDVDPENNMLYIAATNASAVTAELRMVDVGTGMTTLASSFAYSGMGFFAINEKVEPDYMFSWTPTSHLDDPSSANPTASSTITTTYVVTMTDACGTTLTDSIRVDRIPGPSVAFTSLPASPGNPGSATAVASNGTSPYTYLWSTGDTTASINAYGGNYTLTVTDALGCTVTSSVQIEGTTLGLDELAEAGLRNFQVFPNPTQGLCTIHVDLIQPSAVVLRVFDLHGQLIYKEKAAATERFESQIDLSSVSRGVYFIQLVSDQGQMSRRLILD